MASLMERAIGAAKLDPAIYEEVEHDPAAMNQAVTIVVVVALAAGIGAATNGLLAIVLGVILSLVGWCIWAAITWLVGTRLFGTDQTEADFGQLFRTLGFAATPGVLQIFGIIPGIGFLIGFAASIWQLVAMVIAVRQALDYDSTGRAILVCLVGFVVYIAIVVVATSVIGMGAAVVTS
jgi:hypothetical protein